MLAGLNILTHFEHYFPAITFAHGDSYTLEIENCKPGTTFDFTVPVTSIIFTPNPATPDTDNKITVVITTLDVEDSVGAHIVVMNENINGVLFKSHD
jgi:hypothetical protein